MLLELAKAISQKVFSESHFSFLVEKYYSLLSGKSVRYIENSISLHQMVEIENGQIYL